MKEKWWMICSACHVEQMQQLSLRLRGGDSSYNSHYTSFQLHLELTRILLITFPTMNCLAPAYITTFILFFTSLHTKV